MTIECIECGAQGSYNKSQTQCPNDIIDQNPGWSQDDNNCWLCPSCSKERE